MSTRPSTAEIKTVTDIMVTINGERTPDGQEPRLLIVGVDTHKERGLEAFFSDRGYAVTREASGERALREITALPPYDVILLEVRLPDRGGFEVLREARKAGVDSPVILLARRSKPKDKLRGFELGADDYVTKPFDIEELAARVGAVLKRSQWPDHAADGEYSFGEVQVNLGKQLAYRSGEPIEFTDLEFEILEHFIEHRGRTVSRKQLLRDVWGISGDITTRTIDRHVASLRKKIEADPTNPQYIETVYGIGYKFVG